jgi:uncharacterized phage protein (TIGR02220 family)
MEEKKSIIVYADWINVFEELDDAEAGKLIKHFFRYVNDLNPEPPDKLTKIAFEPIKLTLKRDLKKWELIREKRSEAGKISAEKRKQNSTNPTSVDFVQQNSTNPTVSDSVSVSVNDSVINNKADKIDFDALILFINKTFGRSFKKVSPTVKSKYNARLKEGFTKEDFKTAMTNCSKLQFHIDNNFQYCTPEYFSRSEVIDKYSNVTEQESEKELRITDPDTDLANYVNAQVAKYRSV